MARNFHRKNRLTALTEINVTPLIDLAFALLIIFMIATPLLEQSIAVNLPIEAQKQQDTVKPDKIKVISINSQGQYYWDNKQVSAKELSNAFKSISSQKEQPVIDIRADASVSYQRVVTVLDLLKQNKLSKINLDTQVK